MGISTLIALSVHGEKAGNRHGTHHMAPTNLHSKDTQGRQRWLGEGLTGHPLSPMSHQHPRHRPASHPMQRARQRNKQKRGRERERERERAGGGNKQERGREGESHEHLLQKQRNSSKKSGQHFLRPRRLSEEKVGKALSTFLMHTAHLLTLHTFLYLLYTPVHTLMYIIDFAYMTLHPLLYTHTVHT